MGAKIENFSRRTCASLPSRRVIEGHAEACYSRLQLQIDSPGAVGVRSRRVGLIPLGGSTRSQQGLAIRLPLPPHGTPGSETRPRP